MASTGANIADEIPLQIYYCHICNHNVPISFIPDVDPLCPTCNDGFVEEVEDEDPDPNSDLFNALADFLSTFPILFTDSRFPIPTGLNPSNPRSPSLFSPAPRTQTRNDPQQPAAFDPFTFFQDYVGSLRAGGSNIQFVFDNINNPSGVETLPANLGDYFMGPGLEELIQQLAENDPNRYGPPPASRSAVDGLPDVTVDDKLLSSEMSQCAVCQDDFEKDMVLKQMPCKHVYHSQCLLPWLELHNSCPVCRYELPTDDPDYENRASGNASSEGGSDPGVSLSEFLGRNERPFSVVLRVSRRRLRSDSNVGGSNGEASGSSGPQNMDTN